MDVFRNRLTVDPPTPGAVADDAFPWPDDLPSAELPADARCVVRFAPILSLDPKPSVSLFLQVAVGDVIVLNEHRWTFGFDTDDEAALAADWMARHPMDAVSACRVGTRAAFEDLDCWMRVGLVEERLKAEEAEEAEEQARLKREEAAKRATLIESFLVDANGQFGLDLRRASENIGFWRIMFREKWERERFRDWFRCQRPRFEGFAAFLDDHDAVALERMLLAEMLETERRVKVAGLSAGGRRPLRFWRGE